MSVERLVESLRHANALRATQQFLTRKGLGSGRRWEEIAENVEQYIKQKKLTEIEFKEFVTDVHSRAHKLVSLYSVTKKNHKILWEMAKQSQDDVDNDVDFPYVLTEAQLEDLDEKPRHIYTRQTTEGFELVFTSVRIGQRIDEIPIEEIAANVRKNYVDAERMYAERAERRQAFDIVFVPNDSRLVQIRVDTGAISAKDRDTVRVHLETVVISTSGVGATQFAPVNLFRAVEKIYDNEDAGNVTGIHFDETSGSNHTQKMRRTPDGHKDLRQDPFHVAGVEEVGRENIQPFWLSVELEDSELTEPEPLIVVLPGALRHLHRKEPLVAFEMSAFASEAAIAYAAGVIFEHADAT